MGAESQVRKPLPGSLRDRPRNHQGGRMGREADPWAPWLASHRRRALAASEGVRMDPCAMEPGITPPRPRAKGQPRGAAPEPRSPKPEASLPEKREEGASSLIALAARYGHPPAQRTVAHNYASQAFIPTHTQKVYCCLPAFFQSPLPFMQGEGC